MGNTSFEVSNKKQDESGRILILDGKVSDNDFLLINAILLIFYLINSNKESEKLNTQSILCNLLDDITDLHCKNIILGGNFNIFFNLTYEAHGGNPEIKNKSVAIFIHIKESLRHCDIWRVRNLKKKRYTFKQQHVTAFIQRRLDYFLISNNSQESINKMDILTTLLTYHSPISFSLSKNIDISRGHGLWKFNNSLCHKLDFITELKNHLTDEQLCRGYIKYEIRKISIRFSKEKVKKTRAEIVTLENKLKELEQNPDCIFDRKYLDYKNKLEQIQEGKANNVKIRSKCEWYEFGEKSPKFFLDLEKQDPSLNQVRTLLCGEKEVSDKHKINQELECFYKNLITEKSEFQKEDINAYLSEINIPILTEEQSQTCEAL